MTSLAAGPGAALVALADAGLELADEQVDPRGMVALDRHGHRLGEVEDLVVDRADRRTRMIVVASGGLLGLTRSHRLVPVEAVGHIDDAVHVDRSHQQVHLAPSYDPDEAARPSYSSVYGHYGITA